ncbi:MAG: hypothetical protein H6873_09100 [Hyphomicrobiaceae bacterium]|nr:hypothetical protein [Hyphomicrobiaceae bacterium]
MQQSPDWSFWLLVAGVFVVLVAYAIHFVWHGSSQIKGLVSFVNRTPERRRLAAEREAKAGGRYPLWYRALQTTFIVAAIALAAYALYARFAPATP